MKTLRIAVIPGDGIGKEVVPEGIRVLRRYSSFIPTRDPHFEILPGGVGR